MNILYKKVKLNELINTEKLNALNLVRILDSIWSLHIICYKEVFMTENLNFKWFSFSYFLVLLLNILIMEIYNKKNYKKKKSLY